MSAVNNSSSERVRAFFLLNKEASSGLIQMNNDEKRKDGQAERVYGFQL